VAGSPDDVIRLEEERRGDREPERLGRLGVPGVMAGKCTVRLYTPFFRNLHVATLAKRSEAYRDVLRYRVVRVCAEFSRK
jgi:hypothetical protein